MKVCLAQNVSLSDHLALSTYLRSITKYLARQKNIELTLLTSKGSRIPVDLPGNIDIHEIDANLYSLKGNLKYSIGLYNELKELSKKEDIELIHCLYPNSSVLGSIWFKRISPKTKIVYDIRSPWIEMSIERGSIPKYIAPIYRKIAYFSESFFDKYIDGYIFITRGLKKFYENIINLNSKPFDIIPSGVDLNHFSRKDPSIVRSKYNIKDCDFLIGYVGGISKMRELDFILKAFRKLVKSDKNYKLMFVGDGDDRKRLEKISRELHIQKDVIFTGKISYEQIPYYISAFDVGICHLPDRFVFRYSFPMKVLEYLACGVPVLVSNIEAHREIAKVLDGVYIYRNIREFVRIVLNINNINFNFGKDLENFSWHNLTKKVVEIYRGVIH